MEKIKRNKVKIISLIIVLVIAIGVILTQTEIINQIKNRRKAEEETSYAYNNPYIPDGFYYVGGDWDTGFIIEDAANGNQFVWVPVDGTTVKLERKNYSVTDANMDECSEELDSVFSDSVTEYGGYYVARYESGVPEKSNFETADDMDSTGKPISKQGATVWNNISYTNAKASAEQMYATKSEITSSLMNSYAYDTMLTWIESKGFNVETDSKSWGNYSDNSETNGQVELAGTSNTWNANNIYDLAGNVSEWTSEKKDEEYIYRGGSYYNAGNITPAGMREVGNEYKTANTIGFRAIMYKTGESIIEGYNEPYIPDGFTHTEGEWNNGFVIKEDATGNEFVWIPVDGYNLNLDRSEFEKTFATMGKSTDPMEIGFKLSVYSYGGYYVSRYEAGVGDTSGDSAGIPVSKKEATVWTNISQENAKTSAEKMYESNTQINSRLMNSYAYDTMLNWLKKTDYSANIYNVDTDSTSWGNYRNNESTSNSKTLSGSNEQWNANNIYDLAGNVWEWTTETYNKEAVVRGGDYLSNGDVLPAGAREHAVKSSAFDHTGYRILMYKIVQDEDGGEDNAPKLSDGMTPVKWNGTEWVATTPDDEEWYDYSNKKWANVMLQDGSMFVWIPRYAYNIQSNWHTSDVEDIQIKFLKGKTNIPITGESITISDESGEGNWLVHPAFTYGDTQIGGIWVAKYLASLSDATSSSTGSSTDISIKENVLAYATESVSEAYELSTKLNDEGNKGGLNTDDNIIDPHLLKNIEWGAVSYLTHSQYGRNSGISTESASKITGIDKEDSTTGNETGIFDMDKHSYVRKPSGGVYYQYYNEIVAAYVNNGNSRLTTYGESLINAPDRHKDVYEVGTDDTYNDNYLANSKKYGDAIYETSESCSRPAFYPNKSYPFFHRNEVVRNYMFAATDGVNSINGNPADYSAYSTYYNTTCYYHYVFYNMFRPSIVVY